MNVKLNTVAMAAAAWAAAFANGPAQAQPEQRIEITGSSIKRIASEGALPVLTLTKADIERSGATSVRDLIQSLPVMQGFTTASDSVNGGAGGTTTASLRNLGSTYTLVLLNGRRLAPFNSGSTVNLEQLPLAAVERVEILTDGASALYGSDAIAGVVNFITRKNSTAGALDVELAAPQHAGGKEARASISKGFGDLDSDGYNVLAGLSVEKVRPIAANQRDFSRSGVIPFEHKGRKLYFWQLSANANPPNVELIDAAGETLAFYAPTLALNGTCGADPAAFRQGGTCRFDFPATVQAQPEAERKNLFLSGSVKLGASATAFVETLLSDTSLTSRFAPPAQALRLPVNGTLYNRYVLPSLASLQLPEGSVIDSAVMNMRLRDAGLRTNEYRTRGTHVAAGLEGTLLGFDSSVSLTHSKNRIGNRYAGGYASALALDALIESNAFDPFAQGTGAPSDVLASAVLNGTDTDTTTQLDVLSVKGSRALFALGGGDANLGLGLDLTRQRYANFPSPISMGPNALQPDYDDFPIGASQGALPFDSSRRSAGAYVELQLPFSKAFEVSAALRHESYDRARNSRNYDPLGLPLPSADQGNSASKSTYKLGLRFQPSPQWLLRASYGTGFRAPTLQDVAEPLKEFGVTSSARDCPVTSATDPLAAGCRTVPTQYKLQTGGNPFSGDAGLKPENSRQWNVGLRFEPSGAVSLGADLWAVAVKDIITAVPEDTAFDNFATYRGLFSVTTDGATGRPVLTFNQVQLNGAKARSSGVDLDLTGRIGTPLGRLTGRLMATYLIDAYFDYGFGSGQESSIGKLGSDDQVAFRTLLKLQGTLDTGAWSNTVTVHWKPGYRDQTFTAEDGVVRLRNEDGTPGAFTAIDDFRVPATWTLDWQGRWTAQKNLILTAGIKNLLDRKPPLSIKAVAGNMVGYDPRYADGRGRTFQLNAQFRF
jgi:iron complex outermembrane recepter protein